MLWVWGGEFLGTPISAALPLLVVLGTEPGSLWTQAITLAKLYSQPWEPLAQENCFGSREKAKSQGQGHFLGLGLGMKNAAWYPGADFEVVDNMGTAWSWKCGDVGPGQRLIRCEGQAYGGVL